MPVQTFVPKPGKQAEDFKREVLESKTQEELAAEEQYTMFRTAPFDARFPNQNQTRHCYQNFIDYHRCHTLKGEDFEPCNYFKKLYSSLCPNAWVEKWNEQIEEGRFPGRIK